MASSFANIGKNALLEWINETFQLPYVKIEQCASGALYCQILDAIYPGTVPLDKVNFDAKLGHEFLRNYKFLQQSFDKLGVPKAIDVDKLTKGKFQDNLEFLQWMRGYYDQHAHATGYDAVARRHGKGGSSGILKPKSKVVTATPQRAPVATTTTAKATTNKPSPNVRKNQPVQTTPSTINATNNPREIKLRNLEQQVTTLKQTMTDKYARIQDSVGYLRSIEMLCTGQYKDSPYAETILQILYDTDGQDVILPGEEEEQTQDNTIYQEEEESYQEQHHQNMQKEETSYQHEDEEQYQPQEEEQYQQYDEQPKYQDEEQEVMEDLTESEPIEKQEWNEEPEELLEEDNEVQPEYLFEDEAAHA